MNIISLWGEEYLIEQIIFYGQYHKEWRNALIHNIFVPMIVFSGYILAYSLHQIVGYMAMFYYCIVYCTIDLLAGLSWSLVHAAPLYLFTEYAFAHYTVSSIRKISVFVHILSWGLQIGGHVFFEKNRPAFFESAFQSFVTAPLFVWYKAFLFPYMPSYYQNLNSKISQRMVQKLKCNAPKHD
jgi:uncharacterized membrane protein YGL010W